MSRVWVVSALCLFACATQPVFAEEAAAVPAEPSEQTDTAKALAQVREQLSDSPVLRGRFTQLKRIEGFRNPLRSSGSFLMAREHGVIWNTEQPFPSNIVLSRDRLFSREADGSSRVILDSGQSAAMAGVHALLMALIAGDLPRLAEQFSIEALATVQNSWSLLLRPKEAGLQQVFTRIELSGDAHVRRVRIEEKGGDHSEIEFLALSDAPAQLSDAELQLFE